MHRAADLAFFGDLTGLSEPQAFAAYLAPLRKTEWIVYSKPPFGGPEAVLAYLSRYTHRVAISNSRIVNANAHWNRAVSSSRDITAPARILPNKETLLKYGFGREGQNLSDEELQRRFLNWRL